MSGGPSAPFFAYLRSMTPLEKIPITCRVSVETAYAIVTLAHDRFADSMGEAVDFIVSEYEKALPRVTAEKGHP